MVTLPPSFVQRAAGTGGCLGCVKPVRRWSKSEDGRHYLRMGLECFVNITSGGLTSK